MGAPAERLPRFEDLYGLVRALPEGLVGEVYPGGRLQVMGRPGAAHRRAALGLARWLGRFEDDGERPRWWFELEPEVRLGEAVLLVPDLCGWRLAEGSPWPPDWVERQPIDVAPDWVCEILSPSTEARDRGEKMTLYARGGVRWCWLLDPLAHRVEVFRLDADGSAKRVAEATGSRATLLPPLPEAPPLTQLWLHPPTVG